MEPKMKIFSSENSASSLEGRYNKWIEENDVTVVEVIPQMTKAGSPSGQYNSPRWQGEYALFVRYIELKKEEE